MVKTLAKQAMTTKGQKACYVIDHLVEALGNDPSSSLRRAMILTDIDIHPGSTQTQIMDRLDIGKSALNREIEWLFNYGCIITEENKTDARSKKIYVCGYSKSAISNALDYFSGQHANLLFFLKRTAKFLKQEKPTLRDAKMLYSLYEKKDASRQEVLDSLYGGATSTDNRAYKKLVETGIIDDA